jgi:hypothetical protein
MQALARNRAAGRWHNSRTRKVISGGPLKFLPPIVWITRLLLGAYPRWTGSAPTARQRIYFANHTAMDTVVLWAALPEELRSNTRQSLPDYRNKPASRRHRAQRAERRDG